ncbi:MAG: alanine--tRNA ligase [Patescibacteria group bacterium]
MSFEKFAEFCIIATMMTSSEIRQKFLKFFEKRGHAVIPSASLVPENDPSVLFNTAGMQPLVPYLLGKKHSKGTRLVNVQKCVRTQDIDEVGDNTHDTFFEMLGNWSLGDYFKEDAIKWSYELLTSKEEGFGLDPKRLYVTVFGGNDDAPKDMESFEIWKKYIPENRIYFLTWNGKKEPNWWDAGADGPCGPDTEMFYDITEEGIGDMTKEEYLRADSEQKVVEIWNDVFMEFVKKDGKVTGKLSAKNVDTGSGLERLVMAIQKRDNVFATDLFQPLMDKIDEFTSTKDQTLIKSKRIVADHIRTSVFMIGDGVVPSNTEQGYILRRLLRRAVRHADKLSMKHGSLFWIAETVIEKYKEVYPELLERKEIIKTEIDKEEQKFRTTLDRGLKEFEKGTDPFTLFSSYGFPIELTMELAQEKGVVIDIEKFNEEFKKHQELSRSGAEQKFKGGLADAGNPTVVKYHTATHLLHQALHDVLGENANQKGSNITPERLRFDFSHDTKMTDEEKKRVEDIVNKKITEAMPVGNVILPRTEAEKVGARHFFGEKYGEEISIYFIGNDLQSAYSKEFCGGPHVKNTSEIGHFKIVKEEAVSAGVRRIKAVIS